MVVLNAVKIVGANIRWTSRYVFFKLLADGKLHLANSDLTIDHNSYYPIIRILRQQKNFSYEYEIVESDVRISSNHKTDPDIFISRSAFANAAKELIKAIAMAEGNFSVPTAESGATNFQFDINSNLTDLRMEELNNLGIKALIQQLISDGIEISFLKINNTQFALNLQMIDTKMPQIIATMLLAYYAGDGTTLSDLTHAVEEMDPASLGPKNSSFYTHNIKTLLIEVALGMTPSRPWNGEYDATGGYIIVRPGGEIVCFHAYNREEFREYLLVSTKFETGSRKKHNFGHLYRIDSGICIDLNLQIRFL